MENTKQFIDGMRIFGAKQGAPEWIKGQIVVECKELVEFMRKNHTEGKMRIDIKQGKSGNLYLELNTWKPENKPNNAFFGQGKSYEQAIKQEAPLPTIEYPELTDDQIMNIPF